MVNADNHSALTIVSRSTLTIYQDFMQPFSLKRINWLDDLLLPLLVAVMRACWLGPWLGLLYYIFSNGTAVTTVPLLPIWLLALLPLVSFGLARLGARLGTGVAATAKADWSEAASVAGGARWLVAVGGLIGLAVILWWRFYQASFGLLNAGWLAMLGDNLIHWPMTELGSALPTQWLVLVVAAWLWLRGLLDAAQEFSHDDLWGALIRGVIALGLYLVLVSYNALPLPITQTGNALLLLAAGMAGLAFVSLKTTTTLAWAMDGLQRNQSSTPMLNRYWLSSVAITVGLLLALGGGLALLFAPQQIAQLVALLLAVLGWVWGWVSYVLIAFAYVLGFLAYLFALLLQPLIARLLAMMAQLAGKIPIAPVATPQPTEQVVEQVTAVPDAYRWLALVVMVMVALFIFALALRRLRARPVATSDEERESILSTELLQSQLAALWQRLRGRFAAASERFLSLAGEGTTRQHIRRLYQQLLVATSARNQPRRRGQTPQEYAHALAGQLPLTQTTLATLTALYDHARYAGEEPSSIAAEQAQQSWAELEQTLTNGE
jgi:hypothetical protein